MQVDDATAFLLDYLRNPRSTGGYPVFGYEVYLPNVIVAYLREVEHNAEHEQHLRDGKRAADLSTTFYEAAWVLCRRGVLRPGIRRMGLQATDDGASGNGYSLTAAGRQWLDAGEAALIFVEPGRMAQLFGQLAKRFGTGFQQRAAEAVGCHTFGSYLACCAMCGAAAESILLAAAIAKSGNENEVLARYRTAQGRHRTIEYIVGQARAGIADQFRRATELLAYWRDAAAHGGSSTISEIEAHEALARVLRFAQLVADNWIEITAPAKAAPNGP